MLAVKMFCFFYIKECLINIRLAYLTDPRLILQCVTPAYKKCVVYFQNVTDWQICGLSVTWKMLSIELLIPYYINVTEVWWFSIKQRCLWPICWEIDILHAGQCEWIPLKCIQTIKLIYSVLLYEPNWASILTFIIPQNAKVLHWIICIIL